jgi:hypothetical protein
MSSRHETKVVASDANEAARLMELARLNQPRLLFLDPLQQFQRRFVVRALHNLPRTAIASLQNQIATNLF